MNLDSLQERLVLQARSQASRLGWSFAQDCLNDYLVPWIRSGSERLINEGLSDDPVQVALAEANVIRFVTGMIIEARKLGLTELHEPTFFRAKDWFCPCFPFC